MKRVSYYDDSGGYYDATGGYYVDTSAGLSEPDNAVGKQAARGRTGAEHPNASPGSESSSDLALCRELLEHRRMFSGEWDKRVNGALERVIERSN